MYENEMEIIKVLPFVGSIKAQRGKESQELQLEGAYGNGIQFTEFLFYIFFFLYF